MISISKSGYALLVAISLLNSNIDIVDENQYLLVLEGAVRLQLVDYSPSKMFFLNTDTILYGNHINDIRERYKILKDFPKIEDMPNFPTNEEVLIILNYSHGIKETIINNEILSPRYSIELDETKKQCSKIINFWNNIFQAQIIMNKTYIRRLYYKRAMELIGQDAFYAGEYPLPILVEKK